MFGAEEMKEGLPTRRPNALAEADAVTYGLVAQIQDMRYNEEQAEVDAAAARNAAKPKATKKTMTPKKTIITRANRQAEKDVKESAANDEDNDTEDGEPKQPATRHSRRLLGKDGNDSDTTTQPTAPKRKGSDENTVNNPVEKRQKMTIGKSTPARNAPTPTSSPVTDD